MSRQTPLSRTFGTLATLAALFVGALKSAAIGEAEALARPTVPAKATKKDLPLNRHTRAVHGDTRSAKGERRRAMESFWFARFGRSSRQFVKLRKAVQRYARTQTQPQLKVMV